MSVVVETQLFRLSLKTTLSHRTATAIGVVEKCHVTTAASPWTQWKYTLLKYCASQSASSFGCITCDPRSERARLNGKSGFMVTVLLHVYIGFIWNVFWIRMMVWSYKASFTFSHETVILQRCLILTKTCPLFPFPWFFFYFFILSGLRNTRSPVLQFNGELTHWAWCF